MFTPPATALTRALSLLMIALMLVAIAYCSWIAIRNWSHISV
jgi:hypothetical protein